MQPANTLEEMTVMYRKERYNQIILNHGRFENRIPDKHKANLRECVARMALNTSPPDNFAGFDRQIFDIIKNEEENDIIIALNPVAREALIRSHGIGMIENLDFVTEQILSDPGYENRTKGDFIENYIKTILEVRKTFSFQRRKVSSLLI